MKKDFEYEGIQMKAEVEFVTEKDIFKNPTLYEYAEEGDVKSVVIDQIIIKAYQEDPEGALIRLKNDIEDLIVKIKRVKNENK